MEDHAVVDYVEDGAVVPSSWQAVVDEHGRTFYYNENSHATQWEVPDGFEAPPNWQAVVDKQGRTYYYDGATGAVQWDVPDEFEVVPAWQAVVDHLGRTYYHDATTGATQWDVPEGHGNNESKKLVQTSTTPNTTDAAIIQRRQRNAEVLPPPPLASPRKKKDPLPPSPASAQVLGAKVDIGRKDAQNAEREMSWGDGTSQRSKKNPLPFAGSNPMAAAEGLPGDTPATETKKPIKETTEESTKEAAYPLVMSSSVRSARRKLDAGIISQAEFDLIRKCDEEFVDEVFPPPPVSLVMSAAQQSALRKLEGGIISQAEFNQICKCDEEFVDEIFSPAQNAFIPPLPGPSFFHISLPMRRTNNGEPAEPCPIQTRLRKMSAAPACDPPLPGGPPPGPAPPPSDRRSGVHVPPPEKEQGMQEEPPSPTGEQVEAIEFLMEKMDDFWPLWKEALETGILTLSDRGLNDEDVKHLCCLLKGNTRITTMNLELNRIGNEGANHLAVVLDWHNKGAEPDNITLKALGLMHNCIGDAGAEDLAVMLSKNRAIEILALHQNQIGDSGASALANTLSNSVERVGRHKKVDTGNYVIEKLFLMENQIGDEGARAFKGMLNSNVNIKILGLTGNQISEEMRLVLKGYEGPKGRKRGQGHDSLQDTFL
jgi:hypothetical protein